MGKINNQNNKAWVYNKDIAAVFGAEEYLGVYNRDEIENKEDMALIAIHDPDKNHHPDFKVEGFHDVLQINFWDLEESFGDYEILTDNQGKEIKEFIQKNLDKQFLIHCAAGISRSAGVACAVECLKNYQGNNYNYKTGHSNVRNHYRYSPNWTVYDKIIKGTHE